jgi:hypothetical protein
MKYLLGIVMILSSLICSGQIYWEEGHYYNTKGDDVSRCDSSKMDIIPIKECKCHIEQNHNQNDHFAPIKPVIEHTCVKKVVTKYCKRTIWVSEQGTRDVMVWDGKQWLVVKYVGTYWHFYWEYYTETF